MINVAVGVTALPLTSPQAPLFGSPAAPFPLPHPAAACPAPACQVPSAPYPALIHGASPLKIAACLKCRPEAELHKRRRPPPWALAHAIHELSTQKLSRGSASTAALNRRRAIRARASADGLDTDSASAFPGTLISLQARRILLGLALASNRKEGDRP